MSENHTYKESHLRSILKAISWRLVATCTTFLIAYTITGKTTFAMKIAGVEVICKMIIYYFHERIWQLLPRGSVRTMVKNLFHKFQL